MKSFDAHFRVKTDLLSFMIRFDYLKEFSKTYERLHVYKYGHDYKYGQILPADDP